MGNNISIISVMFEEIKGLLTSIDKKLNERLSIKENHSSPATATEPKSDVKIKTVMPEQILRLIATYMQNSDQKIGNISDTIRESEKHIISQMEELKRITVNQIQDYNVRHHHIIDLRSSKVVITIVSLSVLLLVSIFVNIHQFEVNSRMSDNDLKYRYINATNGINPGNLNKLEDIFKYNRDKKQIREIQDKVAEYEIKLNEAAKKLERERLKDTKAKQ